MANSVDGEHLFFISWKAEWIVDVQNQIEYVQWKPSDGEEGGYG